MKAVSSLFLVLSLILAVAGTAVTAHAAEGPFLNDAATSVSQVVGQVEGNRLIALRYAKHFGTDPSSVVAYMKNELVVTTLDQDVTVNVYYMDATRAIATKSVQLKAGTRIFADRAGTPVLQITTGNPLTSSISKSGNLRRLAEGNRLVPESVASAASEAGRTTTELPSEATSDPPDSVVAVALPGEVASSTAGVSSIFSSMPNWLVPAGIVGAAAALAGGGGGGSGESVLPPVVDPPVVPPIVPPNDDPLVPEPGGLVVLGAGLTAFAGFVVRKRRF